MMRLLLLLLGLAVGLAIAAVSAGKMTHLRSFAPEKVPGWAEGLSDASGLMSGRAEGVQLIDLPGSPAIEWQFDRLDTKGPVWRVSLSGTGIKGQGDLRILLSPSGGQLSGGSGEITLQDLPDISDAFRAGGLLSLSDMAAEFAYPGGDMRQLSGRAEWLGAQIDGRDIGTGEVSVISGDSGGWRAPFALSGEVITVTGKLEGRFGLNRAQLELTIDDAGAMPDTWKQALGQQVRRGENGWTLQREVDLTGGWPVF